MQSARAKLRAVRCPRRAWRVFREGGTGVNKTVPTLLGVAIILLVVILALSIYHMTMLARLAEGERVVGTTAQKMLGGNVASEDISPSEPLGARMSKKEVVSPAEVQRKAGNTEKVQTRQSKREARRGARQRGEQAAGKLGD